METLLIIDDFEPVRKTIKRIAEREHFLTLQAVDGREGLDIFEKEHPPIVITDLKMPGIDGRGVLRAIKQRSPETEVIVLTGYGDAETATALLHDGACSFLQKPLNLENLIRVLSQARERTRARSGKQPSTPDIHTRITLDVRSRHNLQIHLEDKMGQSAEALSLMANEIPVPLVVISETLKVLYSNTTLNELLRFRPSTLDNVFFEHLIKSGIDLPPTDELTQNILRIFHEPEATLQAGSLTEYRALGFMKASLATGTGAATPILVILFSPLPVVHIK